MSLNNLFEKVKNHTIIYYLAFKSAENDNIIMTDNEIDDSQLMIYM